jgi:septal ring factor EnvC (AmiA/AmiB activator)
MTDEPTQGHDSDPDLHVRLHQRLRRIRDGHGELTSRELLEMADALTRDREEVGRSLHELRVREAEADELRRALEETTSAAARELEERNAQLTALAAELAAERARLETRAAELDARERRQAAPPPAVERILDELRSRLERIEAAVLRGARRSDEEPEAPEPEGATSLGHILFVATSSGYALVERDGGAPAVGERLPVAEVRGLVTVTGFRASPLPLDDRRCAVCEAEPVSDVAETGV